MSPASLKKKNYRSFAKPFTRALERIDSSCQWEPINTIGACSQGQEACYTQSCQEMAVLPYQVPLGSSEPFLHEGKILEGFPTFLSSWVTSSGELVSEGPVSIQPELSGCLGSVFPDLTQQVSRCSLEGIDSAYPQPVYHHVLGWAVDRQFQGYFQTLPKVPLWVDCFCGCFGFQFQCYVNKVPRLTHNPLLIIEIYI